MKKKQTTKRATIGEKIVGERIADILKVGANAKGTIDRMNSGNYMHHTAQAKSQIDYLLRLLIEPKWLEGLAGAFNRKHSAALKRAVREGYDAGWEDGMSHGTNAQNDGWNRLAKKYGMRGVE